MWVWRRMERLKWTEKIKKKNAGVLERVGEGRIILELIRKRKINWLVKKELTAEGFSRRYSKWEESLR